MAAVTGWSKDGASISEVSVNVGETIVVTAHLGREGEYYRDAMSTTDTSVATASWSPSEFGFSAPVSITGVSSGTTETALIGGYDTQDSPLAITVLSAEDESYLNKRGLTHFWENIDDIKQNKLTAGAGISITNDVISATGGGTADAVDWGHITGSMSNQTDLTTALNAKANTADLAAVATSGSYNDLSNKPTIPGGTITGVSVNNTSIATSGVANIPLVSRNLDGAVPRTNAVGGAYDGYVFGIDADTAKWMKLSYNSLSNTPTKVSDFTNDAGYITSYTDTQVTQTRVDPSAITTFYPVASVSRTTNTGDVKKFSAVKINYVNDDGGRAELELGQNSYNDPVYGELTLWDIGPSSQHKTTLLRATDATNQTFYFPYNADSTSGTLVANGSRTTATGSATNPVYADSDGILHPTTYALNATVPSNAVFTDTTYSDATTSAAGLMSASDKTKLNGIATGAEVNVQANWTQTTTTADDYIKNKPTLATVATSGSYNDLSNKPTIPTVNNGTLTIQKNGTNVQTFTANQSGNVTANIAVPTATSDLTNDGEDGSGAYMDEFAIHATNIDAANGTFTSDKTFDEVKAAYESGKNILLYATMPSSGHSDYIIPLDNVYINEADGEYSFYFDFSVADAMGTGTPIVGGVSNTFVGFYISRYGSSSSDYEYSYGYDRRDAYVSITESLATRPTRNTWVPSAQCVYDIIGNIETVLQTLNSGNGAQ